MAGRQKTFRDWRSPPSSPPPQKGLPGNHRDARRLPARDQRYGGNPAKVPDLRHRCSLIRAPRGRDPVLCAEGAGNRDLHGYRGFAERVNVTLSEKNETYAAVSGALSADDKVISTSKSVIQDGDRVRLPVEELG